MPQLFDQDLDFSPPVKSEASPYPLVALQEVISKFEIINDPSGDGFMLVMPPLELERSKPIQLTSPNLVTASPELGYAGPSQWYGFMRDEYNAELRDSLGLQKYDRMRRNDASVRSSLRLIKTPIMAGRWFVSSFSESKQDRDIAEFIENCLFKWMTISWPQVVWESLLMLDYGYYMFEKVFAFRGDQLIWQKFAPRHPLDIQRWYWDDKGGPRGVQMLAPGPGMQPVNIPISQLAVFSYDREGGDLRGMSALRSAYKHWYFKENLYKIDAIQKERHGIGIPIIKLPPGFSDADKRTAHELGRNLRSNEKAHVVLPPLWEILFAKLEGQHVDALESAKHHSDMIFQNVLGDFMTTVGNTSTDNQHALFLKSTGYIAQIIRDVFNKYCIPELVDYNFPNVDGYPELRARRIGDTQDWRVISFALRNLVGANILQVDDPLEEWIREEMDLPHLDKATVRVVATPQAGQAGPPRQSVAKNQKNAPGHGSGNDASGSSGVQTA